MFRVESAVPLSSAESAFGGWQPVRTKAIDKTAVSNGRMVFVLSNMQAFLLLYGRDALQMLVHHQNGFIHDAFDIRILCGGRFGPEFFGQIC